MGNSANSKLNTCKNFYVADYSNADDAAYILELYGGEENLKNNYPLVYECFLRTVERDTKLTKSTENQTKPSDSIMMSSPVLFKNEAKSQITAFLTDPDLTIQDLNNGKTARNWKSANITAKYVNRYKPSIPSPSVSHFGENTNQFHFPSSAVFSNEGLAKDSALKVILNGIDPNGFMKTMTKNSLAALVNVPMVSKFSVEHPKSAFNNNPVIMLYGRSRRNSESYINADYYNDGFEGEYYTNQPIGDKFKTLMPMKGEIVFAQNCKLTKDSVLFKPSTEGYLTRSVISVGSPIVATHFDEYNDQQAYQKMNSCFELNVKDNIPTVTFDIKGNSKNGLPLNSVNWYSDVEGVSAWSNFSVVYHLMAGFELDVTDPNNNKCVVEITIISCEKNKLPPGQKYYQSENSLTVFVPPIKVYWGCFARDTLVHLENGTQKHIDELAVGDKVITYGGHTATFQENISGEEKEILKISTDKGAIRLTGSHPVMKADGTIINAELIKKGDVLAGDSGNHTVSEVSQEDYNDIVFNPAFEESSDDGVFIIANGFYCGDFYSQNKTPEMQAFELNEEDKALVNQFKALHESIQAGE
jgi:hypothetical protein